MILPRWIHPSRWKISPRDDSPSVDSSLPMKNLSQRWFSPANFIPPDKNPLAGMNLPRKFHPCRWKISRRDDFSLQISSLLMKNLSQGWFFPANFIPADEKSLSGMNLPCKFHPSRWKISLGDAYPADFRAWWRIGVSLYATAPARAGENWGKLEKCDISGEQ